MLTPRPSRTGTAVVVLLVACSAVGPLSPPLPRRAFSYGCSAASKTNAETSAYGCGGSPVLRREGAAAYGPGGDRFPTRLCGADTGSVDPPLEPPGHHLSAAALRDFVTQGYHLAHLADDGGLHERAHAELARAVTSPLHPPGNPGPCGWRGVCAALSAVLLSRLQ